METELYRAKRVDNNDWVYGPYAFYASNKGLKRAIYTGTNLGCVIPIEVVPDTVGRCTGIRDINGTLIFQGDILKITYDDDTFYTTEVRAYGSTLCVDVEGEDYNFTAIDFAVDDWKDEYCDWEVVGNIYDNQEEQKTNEAV